MKSSPCLVFMISMADRWELHRHRQLVKALTGGCAELQPLHLISRENCLSPGHHSRVHALSGAGGAPRAPRGLSVPWRIHLQLSLGWHSSLTRWRLSGGERQLRLPTFLYTTETPPTLASVITVFCSELQRKGFNGQGNNTQKRERGLKANSNDSTKQKKQD